MRRATHDLRLYEIDTENGMMLAIVDPAAERREDVELSPKVIGKYREELEPKKTSFHRERGRNDGGSREMGKKSVKAKARTSGQESE